MDEHSTTLPTFKRKGASFVQTCFNGLNALAGIGIVAMPYALARSGWFGLVFLLGTALLTCYTAILLQWCMETDPSIQTYADIGHRAFGRGGRRVIATFIYTQSYLAPTAYLIMEGDNLFKLFPSFHLLLGGHDIKGEDLFLIIAGLATLPLVWVRDLRSLSLISASGIVSVVIIIAAITWVGAVEGVGFSSGGSVLELNGVPTTLSLLVFAYGGHEVFPTIYSSMEDKRQFPKAMVVVFGLTTLLNTVMATVGYGMFGRNTQSQITLNLPLSKAGSRIAIYTALVAPIMKYPLFVFPLVIAIEKNFLGKDGSSGVNWPLSIVMRTLIVISSVVLAIIFPYFGYLAALIGSVLDVASSILLPSACYLKIFYSHGKHRRVEVTLILFIIVAGVLVSIVGTYLSFSDAIRHHA